MTSCEQFLSRVDLYLDGELRREALQEFGRHVKECASCQAKLTERRQLLETIRTAQPLYVPSREFRTKMAHLLAAEDGASGLANLQPQVRLEAPKHNSLSWLVWLRSHRVPALIACALAIAGIVGVWRLSTTDANAKAFLDVAIESHLQEMAEQVPLDVRTHSPTEVSSWFMNKVPFPFRLPTSQKTPGQEKKYELMGGRLINFRGANAAYIAYRMQDQLISLVVTSASTAVASGGEKTVSRHLTFHSHRKGGFQIVTWSTHNLTYALVSGITLPATQSCIVCHGSAKDKTLLRRLRLPKKQSADRGKARLTVILTSPMWRHITAGTG